MKKSMSGNAERWAGHSWYRPGPMWDQVVLLSEFVAWDSHWDPGARRSRRCGGARCRLCSEGVGYVRRWVALVRDRSGIRYWLELRSRHHPEIMRLWGLIDHGVGAVLEIRKGGAAVNAPVFVRVGDDWEEVQREEITGFVESLGAEPARPLRGDSTEFSTEADS